jgi:putative isomerase
VHNFQAALFESGLDNSPMYDGVPFNPKTNLLEISDVGLNALYVADCRALEEMARILGHEDGPTRIAGARRQVRRRAGDALGREVGHVFEPAHRYRRVLVTRLSPTNFYPLIAKVATQEQARA